MDKHKSLDYQTFRNFGVIYTIALGSIAIFTIGSQFFIQRFLSNQINDSKIINISGRQRMLSQKIAKDILLITTIKDKESNKFIDDLRLSMILFEDSHKFLKHYADSLYTTDRSYKTIHTQFKDLQPYYLKLQSLGAKTLNHVDTNEKILPLRDELLSEIQLAESSFLKIMNQIVFDFDSKAKAKVTTLKRIEYVLFIIIIVILILEFLILFRPLAISTNRTIRELTASKEQADESAEHLEELRKIQEENIQELLSHIKAIDKTLLYARVHQNGDVILLGQRFQRMLGIDQNPKEDNLLKLLNLPEPHKSRFLEMLSRNNGSILNEEFEYIDKRNNQIKRLDVCILSIHRSIQKPEKLVLCSDISKRIEAKRK